MRRAIGRPGLCVLERATAMPRARQRFWSWSWSCSPPLDAKAHVGRRATVAGCHGVMSDVGGWLRLCSAIQTITGIRAEVARQPTNVHGDYQRDYRAVSQVGRCGRSQGVQQSARDRRQTGRRCYALGACGSTPS